MEGKSSIDSYFFNSIMDEKEASILWDKVRTSELIPNKKEKVVVETKQVKSLETVTK